MSANTTSAQSKDSSPVAALLARVRMAVKGDGAMNEAQTRRVLVEPTLRHLGWDIEGPQEVKSEFQVLKDRVDYALLVNNQPSLLVETKRVKSNLNELSSIAQAVNYGNTLNVPWAVLTNGHEWNLYCVHAQADMPDKLFKHIDLLQTTVQAAADFLDLISKESILSGQISKRWIVEQETRRNLKSGDIRHAAQGDEGFKRCILRIESILGEALYNEGGRNTFVSRKGKTVQFSKSSPYKGGDGRFMKIRPTHLSGDWFVVWCPDKPIAWMMPTAILRDFLENIPQSKRSTGGASWDPRIGKLDGIEHLWTNIATHGSMNVESFRIDM